MAHLLKLAVSAGPADNAHVDNREISFEDLAKELSSPGIGNKDGSYFLRSSGTYRSNATTAQVADILILDGDKRIGDSGEVLDGAPDPKGVKEVLDSLGTKYIIYSSYSNGKLDAEGNPMHKYRVVIPCKYTREQLPALVDHYLGVMHLFGVMLAPVSENLRWAQAWYFPRTDGNKKLSYHFSAAFDGAHENVSEIYERWKASQPEKKAVETPAGERVFKPRFEGERDVVGEFNEQNFVFDLLEKYGYTQDDRDPTRWLHPGSSSGIPGTVVMPNGLVWSHSDSDPLNDGHPHDAFDLYRILECDGNYDIARLWDEELDRHNRAAYAQHMKAQEAEKLFEPVKDPEKPGEQKEPRFKVLKHSDILSRPRMTWLVPGAVPERGVCSVLGQSGAGKSFFVLNLSGSIAMGYEWYGKKVVQGDVIYVCAEGDADFRNRYEAYAQDKGLEGDELRIGCVFDAPNITKQLDVAELITAIEASEFKPKVIVLDTLAQVTPGANENTSDGMGPALYNAKTLSRYFDCVVILVHHMDKGGNGSRGWTGIKAAMDVEITVTCDEESKQRKGTVTKNKAGLTGVEYPFDLEIVALYSDNIDPGDEPTTCVVRVPKEILDEARKQKPKGKWQEFVCSELTAQDATEAELLEKAMLHFAQDFDGRDRRKEMTRQAVKALIASNLVSKLDNGTLQIVSDPMFDSVED